MSAHLTIKRYLLILQKVMSQRYPSFEEIKTHLEEQGMTLSRRTLQRDIDALRNEFATEITYNRAKDGYVLSEDGKEVSDTLLRFMELLETAELLSENVREGKDLLHFISFEHHGNLKGIENLRLIVPAIQSRKLISFTHFSFHTGKQKTYSIQPYLLKEYQGRWYVVGLPGSNKEFRTFGLDRITNLRVHSEKFRRISDVDPRRFFDDVVGLVYAGSDTEDVEILVDDVQVKYLGALPLHHSQKIEPSKKGWHTLTLRVKPNYELIQRILMQGEHVVVQKPESLRLEIKSLLKAMGGLYK